jgi:hypothetical protein
MAEMEPTENIGDLEGFSIAVYDTEVVPEYIWRAAQNVHRESLKALLPAEQQDRADFLVKANDFPAYRASRVDPNLLVGNPWNPDHIFRRPKFAATFDRSNQLVGGVLTADNSSASSRTPQSLRPAEYWAKMLTPPGIPIPAIGNRRHVHLREVFTHPELQARPKAKDEIAVVSSIALAGIYYSITEAHDQQPLSAHIFPTDPADAELTDVSVALGMSETGYRNPHTLPGYLESDKLVSVRAQVEQVMKGILEIPEALSAVDSIQVSRVTKSSVRQDQKKQHNKNEREYWHNYTEQQETRDWSK